MTELVRGVLTGQFEAALAMLKQCIGACPPEHWEGKVANDTFRTIAYHTLFFVEFYLSPGEHAFVVRDVHRRGGDERGPEPSPGLSQEETLAVQHPAHPAPHRRDERPPAARRSDHGCEGLVVGAHGLALTRRR